MTRARSANQFDVIGGVTQSEIDLLEPAASGDRAYIVQTWIVRLMTNRLAAGGLAIPPPLLSRTYQVLSDGTAAAMQARKVSYVAFPFPLRQLLVLLLLVFTVIAPMCARRLRAPLTRPPPLRESSLTGRRHAVYASYAQCAPPTPFLYGPAGASRRL